MLKQLIQRLLDSRTTPAQAANSSMPSDSSIAVQMLQTATVDWDNVANYTAPTDGFISARGMSTSANAYFQIMAGNAATNPSTSLQVSTVNQWPQIVLPVAKGRNIAIYAAMMRDISVFFNSSIGGGYNILVRRVLSCLRPSFNYLPRSFCKAKNSGLAVKHSLKQLLHWMFRHVPSLHRLMGILDTSTLSAVEANSCSIWIRVKKYLAVKSLVIAGFLQQTPTARQQYLSRKAVLLLLLPTRCSVKFGLLRLQARHNLRTGGALC